MVRIASFFLVLASLLVAGAAAAADAGADAGTDGGGPKTTPTDGGGRTIFDDGGADAGEPTSTSSDDGGCRLAARGSTPKADAALVALGLLVAVRRRRVTSA